MKRGVVVPLALLAAACSSRSPVALAPVAQSSSAVPTPPAPSTVEPTSEAPPASSAPPSASRPAPTAASTAPRPSPAALPTCASLVTDWDVPRLAARVVAVPVNMSGPAAATEQVRAGAGAVLLLGSSPAPSVRSQLAALHAAGSPAPSVLVDEEGGGIQHLSSLVGSLPWPRDAAASQSPAQVRANVAAVARNLRALGVDTDLAPVLDLDTGPGPDDQHPDGKRSFSGTPAVAGTYGTAFAEGLADAGVGAVAKHFPGLGTASGNTDAGAAATAPYSTLVARDLVPFQTVIAGTRAAVMVSNATTPGLTDVPATLSPAVVTTLLRGQLGFAGPVVSDSLTAAAISDAGYTVPQAAVLAVRAGVDLVLYGSTATLDDAGPVFTEVTAALQQAVTDGALTVVRLREAAAHTLLLTPGRCR